MEEAIVALRRYNDAQTTSNKVMGAAKNRMNGNNMAIQQLGYQFGDFAVQVQSGTSAFVAFSQQGAQLAGILPMIASPLGLSVGKAVALSAALGILIPIGSAVGRMFFEMKAANDEAAESVETLDEKLKSLNTTLEDYSNTLAAIKAGVSLDVLFAGRGVSGAKEELAKAREELIALQETMNLSGPYDPTAGQVAGATAMFEAVKSLFGKDKQSEYEAAVEKVIAAETRLQKVREKEADERASNFVEAARARNEELDLLLAQEKYGKNSAQAINTALEQELRSRKAAIDARVEAGELDKNAAAVLKRDLERAAKVAAQVKQNAKNEKAAAEHLEKVNALAESDARRRFESVLKYIAEEAKAKEDAQKAGAEHLKKVNALAKSDAKRRVQSVLRYIEEEAKAKEDAEKKARADQKRYFTEGQAANKVFVDSLNEGAEEASRKAKKQIDLVAQLEEKYGETLVTALALAGVDISASMSDFIDKAVKAQSDLEGLDETYKTQLDIVNAQIKALEEGKNAEVAAFIEGEKAKITALYETSKAFAIQANDIVALAEASLAFLAAMGELDALAAARTKLAEFQGTSKGSSKKSPAEQLREYLDTLGKQAELESKLVGLFGEKRNAEEEVIKARQKYGEVFGATQEAELRGTLAQIEADKQRQKVLEEARSQQQQIADTIQSSMEDAFMSIVDGTKSAEDAFKDMARIIIKELYKVLVVQQLVGSFEAGGGGILGSLFGATQADGGAWQGGSQIKAYANGGIVGAPTVFPMARGKIGLMGEAGPEAIMPLKRGANGKLGVQAEGGGGDNVVVHQNFNFQANGDDSVKRIIAQAAPQIANMTKKSMLDDRRRGGQMKATFG